MKEYHKDEFYNLEAIVISVVPENYVLRLKSTIDGFEQDKIRDEIFDLYLLIQDLIYDIGRNYKIDRYIILLDKIKKLSVLDYYIYDRLFSKLYYSSYERFYAVIEEVVNLSRKKIVILKCLQDVQDEHVKNRYSFAKFLIMKKLNKKKESLEERLILLDFKKENGFILGLLRDLKKFELYFNYCKKNIKIDVFKDKDHIEIRENVLSKINNAIINKLELAIALVDIDRITRAKEYLEDNQRLRDAIGIINPDYWDIKMQQTLSRLAGRLGECQPVVKAPVYSYRMRLFEPATVSRDNLQNIINDLIRLPEEDELESLLYLQEGFDINVEEIIKIITDRQEMQKSRLVEKIYRFK